MTASSTIASNIAPSSPEEAELFIRNISHHGFRHNDLLTSEQIQEAIDSFLPYADQILAFPKAHYFIEKQPSSPVVHWTLRQKCYPLLRYLVHNGWDMNRGDIGTSTGCISLLGERSVLQDIDLTRFLLAQGMDPSIGATPLPKPLLPTRYSKGWLLHLAAIFSTVEIFKLLQSHGANLSYSHALHGAAYGGPSQTPIIRYLLDTKAVDVDELDVYHLPHVGTPLLGAVRKGHVEVVKVLLEYGAHPLACIKSPYEADAEQIARGLAKEDEVASKDILRLLEEAKTERERNGMLGNVPVTGAVKNQVS